MKQLSNANINAVADLKPGYTLSAADVALLQEMARSLLAVEGREPVGVVRAVNTLSGMTGLHVSLFEKLPVGTEVYAAPQPAPVAQPVQVPNEWRKWVDDVVEYLEGGLEADGEFEAEGSIEAKRLLACRAAMLQPSNGALQLPDGWKLVPVEPTHDMLNAWLSEVANWRGHVAGYKAMLDAAPQEPTK